MQSANSPKTPDSQGFSELPFDVSYVFDERLHDVPCAPEQVRAAVDWLLERAAATPDLREQARLLGRAGGYARMLRELPAAYAALGQARELCRTIGDIRLLTVVELRLAHTLQWDGRFAEADALFAELIARCAQDQALDDLRDFAAQHAGKSLLDQGRFAEAAQHFTQALELRQARDDPALIASSRQALELAQQGIRQSVQMYDLKDDDL